MALHGAVAGNHILNHAGQHVADVGLAVSRGRAVVEGVGLPLLTLLQGLLEHLVVGPELQHLALTLYKIHIGRYFLVHLIYLQTIKNPPSRQTGRRSNFAIPPIDTYHHTQPQ